MHMLSRDPFSTSSVSARSMEGTSSTPTFMEFLGETLERSLLTKSLYWTILVFFALNYPPTFFAVS
ncbi:hypothetical protein C5167_003400 [Papaver somniferum]|uniref:Uncharacterized protein n=1 Tax=Papaver somniferum TaxID=3469 RepID=A0A4Y7L4L2_PAPSO|nr:hypothetical protein C5167_003400 [Papaver somniferum]